MSRRKLWELMDYQCPILGTCLTMGDLYATIRKLDLTFKESLSEFEVHGFFVQQAKQPERIARCLNKLLDRKHATSLRRFRLAKNDAEILALWRERVKEGDIPGPFWAVMSHAEASPRLMGQVFGEVHMLSHLLGAANRADLRRLAQLERRAAELEDALAERRQVLRNAVAVWKGRCREMERRAEAERAAREAGERERVSLRQVVESSAVAAVSREREDLARQLELALDRLAEANRERAVQALRLEGQAAELEEARALLADREDTVAAVEAILAQAMAGEGAMAGEAGACAGGSCDDCRDGRCAGGCAGGECPCPRLNGKKVLYVGGRCNLAAHYKSLARKFGCDLVCHDGGVEQSPHRLYSLLSAADAVVCPVDCVSHEACLLVKRACKNCVKPLVLSRSSGLGGLARSLAELERTVQ